MASARANSARMSATGPMMRPELRNFWRVVDHGLGRDATGLSVLPSYKSFGKGDGGSGQHATV